MRYVSSSEMRAIDTAILEPTCHFPDVPLPERLIKLASLGVADLVVELCGTAGRPCVHVVFGGGHNGADAVYAGLELAARGYCVRYLATFAAAVVKGPVQGLLAAGMLPNVVWFDSDRPWTSMPASTVADGDVVLDGILGIGVTGAPREPAADAIRFINRLKGRARIVSVDVPSGLDADHGTAAGEAVEADITLCMGLPKTGFVNPEALRYCGSVHLHDLAMPEAVAHGDVDPARDELVTVHDVARSIPRRRWDAHKGDFGHVCVVGGCARYRGAPALAALGALRAGAGLVTAAVPVGIADAVASHAPEMMILPLDAVGVTSAALKATGFSFVGKTLVVGPGMSGQPGTRDTLGWLLECSGAYATVLDADALNLVGDEAASLADCDMPMILTPHPGEAARLLRCSAAEVQTDRPAALRKLVAMTQKAVILKGAGTLVSAPGRGVHLVACANPGLARGGMGDVLAGVAGAMIARGLEPFDAARAAAWLHARAGDVAAWRRGREAMLATDLVNCL